MSYILIQLEKSLVFVFDFNWMKGNVYNDSITVTLKVLRLFFYSKKRDHLYPLVAADGLKQQGGKSRWRRNMREQISISSTQQSEHILYPPQPPTLLFP